MIKVTVEAKVKGTCEIYAVAATKEEALSKINGGDWEITKGSEEWECNPVNELSSDDILNTEDLAKIG